MTQEEKNAYWSERINNTNKWLEDNGEKYYKNSQTGKIVFYNEREVPEYVLDVVGRRNKLDREKTRAFCERLNEMFGKNN